MNKPRSLRHNSLSLHNIHKAQSDLAPPYSPPKKPYQLDFFPDDIWDYLAIEQRKSLIDHLELKTLFAAYKYKYTDPWDALPLLLRELIIEFLQLENPPILLNLVIEHQ